MSVWTQIQEAAVSPVSQEQGYEIFGVDLKGHRFSKPANSSSYDYAMIEWLSPSDTREEQLRGILIRGISEVVQYWDTGAQKPLIYREEHVLAIKPTELGESQVGRFLVTELGAGLFGNKPRRFVTINGAINREGILEMGFNINSGLVMFAAFLKGNKDSRNLLRVT